MNEKEVIKTEDESGIQYLIRLKGYKSKQSIKIKVKKHSCLTSFIILSENHVNLEVKDGFKNVLAKACTCPQSTKVYQKLFKQQLIKENQNIIFEISRQKGFVNLYNADLTFKLYYIKEKQTDEDIDKDKQDAILNNGLNNEK